MRTDLIRIQHEDKVIVQKLAAEEDAKIIQVIHRALEEYRRKKFLQKANERFLVLKKNAKAWKAVAKERALWEKSNLDGLRD